MTGPMIGTVMKYIDMQEAEHSTHEVWLVKKFTTLFENDDVIWELVRALDKAKSKSLPDKDVEKLVTQPYQWWISSCKTPEIVLQILKLRQMRSLFEAKGTLRLTTKKSRPVTI